MALLATVPIRALLSLSDHRRGRQAPDQALRRPPSLVTADVYCEPWSLWCTTPRGRRCHIAMFSASRTNSVRRWVAIDQPTTRRLQASSTTTIE